MIEYFSNPKKRESKISDPKNKTSLSVKILLSTDPGRYMFNHVKITHLQSLKLVVEIKPVKFKVKPVIVFSRLLLTTINY